MNDIDTTLHRRIVNLECDNARLLTAYQRECDYATIVTAQVDGLVAENEELRARLVRMGVRL